MTRNERLQRKRLSIAVIVVMVVTLAAVAVLLTTIYRQIRENHVPEIAVCSNAEWEAAHPPKTAETEYLEDPFEGEKIAAAVIATIGTEREEECFGFDATYVLKMLTAECGDDSDLCWAVATAIFNECVKLGNRYTPVDVINGNNDAKYHLTAEPADYISEAALTYFCKVFVRCDLCKDIGKATLFYNPAYMLTIPSHEQHKYITTISGVRFFEETA